MPPMICFRSMLPALSIQLLQGKALQVQGGELQLGSVFVGVVRKFALGRVAVLAVLVHFKWGKWVVTTPAVSVTIR